MQGLFFSLWQLLVLCVYRDHATLALGLELYNTVDCGEQGVVASDTDVGSGVELRAALAHEDVTGFYELAAEALNAQALSIRVATVLCGATTFFVSHDSTPFSIILPREAAEALAVDRCDLDFCKTLAMSVLLAIALAALLLEDQNFGSLAMAQYFCRNGSTGNHRSTNLYYTVCFRQEDLVKRYFFANTAGERRNLNHVIRLHAEL